MKSWSREIRCYFNRIILEFERHLDSTAAELPVKIQNSWKSSNPNSRLRSFNGSCGKTSVRLMKRVPGWLIVWLPEWWLLHWHCGYDKNICLSVCLFVCFTSPTAFSDLELSVVYVHLPYTCSLLFLITRPNANNMPALYNLFDTSIIIEISNRQQDTQILIWLDWLQYAARFSGYWPIASRLVNLQLNANVTAGFNSTVELQIRYGDRAPFGDTHHKYEEFVRPSCIYNGNSSTSKVASLHWNGP